MKMNVLLFYFYYLQKQYAYKYSMIVPVNKIVHFKLLKLCYSSLFSGHSFSQLFHINFKMPTVRFLRAL